MKVSDLTKSSGGASGDHTGIIIGETIMMYAPPGTAAYERFHVLGKMEIETPSGTEIFVSRDIDRGFSNAADYGYFQNFKNTNFLRRAKLSTAMQTYANLFLNTFIDVDTGLTSAEAVHGPLKGILGFTLSKYYQLKLWATFDDPGLSLGFRLVIFSIDLDNGSISEDYALPDKYCGSQYTYPQVFEIEGEEYYSLFTDKHIIFSAVNWEIECLDGLHRENLRPIRSYSSLTYRASNKAIIGTNSRRNQDIIQEINGTYVCNMARIISSANDQNTATYRMAYSYNLIDWREIPEDHFTNNTHPGYLSNAYFHYCYFRDDVNNRLCMIVRTGITPNEIVVYFTEDGIHWARGITLRTDWQIEVWENDSSNPNTELGDDYIPTVDVCGEVVYTDGHWYVGWSNRLKNTSDQSKIAMSRFSDYTLGGESTLEHITSKMRRRNCLVQWNTQGPPALEERSQCAIGFMISTSGVVCVHRPYSDEDTLHEWYYHGTDSARWDIYDLYTSFHNSDDPNYNVIDRFMRSSDIPDYWDAVLAASQSQTLPSWDNVEWLDYETSEMGQCYTGGVSGTSQENTKGNTFPVRSSAFKDLLYHLGSIRGRYAFNFGAERDQYAQTDTFYLDKIEGYDSSWDNVLPVTRID